MRYAIDLAALRPETDALMPAHHPVKPAANRCAHCVGRVGALAVALGIGLALATAPAVAWADENTSETSASTDTTGNSHPTHASGDRERGARHSDDDGPDVADDTTTPEADHDARGTHDRHRQNHHGEGPQTESESAGTGASSGDDGRHVDAEAERPADDAPEPVHDSSPDASGMLAGTSSGHGPNRSATAERGSDSRADATDTKATIGLVDGAGVAATGGKAQESRADAIPASVSQANAVGIQTASTTTATAATEPTPPRASTAAPDPVTSLLGVPHTMLSVALDVVGTALSPLGPLAPTDNPVLLGVLAWARRQFTLNYAAQDVQGIAAAAAPTMVTDPSSTMPAGAGAPTGLVAVSGPGPGGGNDGEFENLLQTLDLVPIVGNIARGLALAPDLVQFLTAISSGDRQSAQDQADTLAADIAGTFLPVPLNLLLRDAVENITEDLIDNLLGSQGSGSGSGGSGTA